ncbi:MAG TPA: glycosyltransferase family 4 protein [Chloroflexia bacterium]|nr:glycosyltransferase family 4 protein [Chloroflexia bacterium]
MSAMPASANSTPRRPLRVLYFIGSYGPAAMGNASHEETILALRARGHSVDVFTQVTEPGRAAFLRSTHGGVPVYSVNLSAKGSRFARAMRPLALRLLQYEYLPVLLRAYRRHLGTHRYDLVHVEGAYPFGLVAALGSGGTPFMANVQGADVIKLPEADYGYRRFRMPDLTVRMVLKRAALVRVISPFLRDYVVREGLARAGQMVVVLRSIEDAAFPPPDSDLDAFRGAARRWLADRYGVGLDRPLLVSLSRLHPFKGLEFLVDAIPAIVAEQRQRGGQPPWFLICGPSRSTEHFGDYKQFLRNRAESLGVAQHIVFTGQVAHEDVRAHLAGAEILVCPSIIEAQNKVVPEACAVGTPSVVTTTTGITSYLEPMEACVAVPPRSAARIAGAVGDLLSNPGRYADVQGHALDAAETLRKEALTPLLEQAWYRAAGR